ncbi:hypothetical protein [Comamonas testosteroni]|uniref:hypothetical protein n=1 Tax=Comamonas testosteroni TaxID=285 RepID=UPI0006B8A74C|nr:hypothetical protein [Comamonas testosteroni]
MSKIPNRTEAQTGARYRACPWSDIHKPGAPVVGYGLQEKLQGERFYRPIGWKGEAFPWATLAEARAQAGKLNAEAQQTQGGSDGA